MNIVTVSCGSGREMDIYTPAGKELSSLPLLLWFHGGAGTGSDRRDALPLAEALCPLGIALAAPDYAFPPQEGCPEKQAVEIAAALGAKKLFVGGHSSGAHTALFLALDEKRRPAAEIAGWVFASPAVFAHPLTLEQRGMDSRRIVSDETAPIFHIVKGQKYAPMLITCGTKDSFPYRLQQAELLAAALKAADKKADIRLHLLEGEAHGSYLASKLPPLIKELML